MTDCKAQKSQINKILRMSEKSNTKTEKRRNEDTRKGLEIEPILKFIDNRQIEW